jgi:hypothetical protein
MVVFYGTFVILGDLRVLCGKTGICSQPVGLPQKR